MLRIENHCCDCAVPGYPCRGTSCSLRSVKVHYCDHCDSEIEEIYVVDGEDLCEECLKKMFIKNTED